MNNFITREAKPLNINCLENLPPGILEYRLRKKEKQRTLHLFVAVKILKM